ncbi:hypothetical protein SAMN05444166_6285 [Singulisphaera sp. GP187]|uniref:hypothetical protein n=1 Tax=Singulisphaera sp. GP187 TaxID=1882752 RepID=UPI0009274B4E|nr:hypothetical protein [Singulisphaera sp. GP187]SIO60150.1 hypothetical protein SAMN05444166_6285 [Singulisphaera sp. GP187]
MNDTKIQAPWPTGGNTLYTHISNINVEFWDGSAYVPAELANWQAYATDTPEAPAGFGVRVCQFPLTSPAGYYLWSVYLQAGGSPASTDVRIGGGSGYWDGTTFGNSPATTATNATLASYDQLLLSGSVEDPAPTTTTFRGSSTFAVDSNHYNGRQVCFTSGDLQGLKQPISTYVGATRSFTVLPGFPFPPTDGDTFNII